MKKDRFVAFFDAVMAIIMTIVALELVLPEGTEWKDLNVLVFQIIAYAVSFFWLGGMWINIHGFWHDVKEIDRPIIWVNISALFFFSMIPFFTVYFGRNITAKVPALLYALDIICITICNYVSARMLVKKNPEVKKSLRHFTWFEVIDLSVKATGAVIGAILFPPAVLIMVVISITVTACYRKIFFRRAPKKEI